MTFDLIISKETLAKEYSHALAEVAKTTEIKGFRKGKAPLKMVEAQTDKSQLYSHVLDHALSPAYSEVIHEHKLTPIIEPHVTPKSMKVGEDWVMAVEVAIAPVFQLGDYAKSIKKIKETDKDKKLSLILATLLKETKFEVAPILIEAEVKSALSRLTKQLTSLKLSVEDYAKSIKKTTKELISEYQESATNNLRLEFILHRIDPDRQKALDFLSAL